MYKKFTAQLINLLLSANLIFLLTSCGKESTALSFSYHTTSPCNSASEKVIYFNESYEHVVLDADLQIDTGSVYLQITDTDDTIIWNNTFDKGGNYQIDLDHVTADHEYTLTLQAYQTQSVNLQISSSVKLVQDKEKP